MFFQFELLSDVRSPLHAIWDDLLPPPGPTNLDLYKIKTPRDRFTAGKTSTARNLNVKILIYLFRVNKLNNVSKWLWLFKFLCKTNKL